MSSWAHAAVAAVASVPDPFAGVMSLSPPVAAAAASLDRNSVTGSYGCAHVLLMMTRDESLPIGIRELCGQQAAARIAHHITQRETAVSPEHAWSLLQLLLPSPCNAPVIASMRVLHFATALKACTSSALLPRSTLPSHFVQHLCDFDLQRVMRAASAGCEGEGRVSQLCCRYVAAAALQLVGIHCVTVQQRVCAFMQNVSSCQLQLLLALLQQLPLYPISGCYSALLTAVTYGVLANCALPAAASAAAAAAVSPYCFTEFTAHVLARTRRHLQRWQAQQLCRTCQADAARRGSSGPVSSLLRLQPAWTVAMPASCWGRCGGVAMSRDSSDSSSSLWFLSHALRISVAPLKLPLIDAADVSHSIHHYMTHHMRARAETSIQFAFSNCLEACDMAVAGVRMRVGGSLARDNLQWVSSSHGAGLLPRASQRCCSIALPAARRAVELQLCCFRCDSGSACCSPWLLLDDAATLITQPLPCSAFCLLQVLRAVSECCNHRTRASVAIGDGKALEELLQRFPSRAQEAADGGCVTWVGARAAHGHIVCRVAPCVMLRVCNDGDEGEKVVQVKGVAADVAGEDADAVREASVTHTLSLPAMKCDI